MGISGWSATGITEKEETYQNRLVFKLGPQLVNEQRCGGKDHIDELMHLRTMALQSVLMWTMFS